jgi:hypothetical protein
MTRALALTLLLAAALAGAAGARQDTMATQYGVPPAGPATLDLSGTWKVNTAPFLNRAQLAPDFDDADWRAVPVPGRWRDQGIEPAAGRPTVAIYRRAFRTPPEWRGERVGLAAWLNPGFGVLALNGIELEPEGEAPWLYADVTDLLNAGGDNLLAVSTQFDGIHETLLPNPPRVGPLGEWSIPALTELPVSVAAAGERVRATAYAPLGDEARPGVLMIGTGSHGLSFVEPFVPLARELAYHGYVTLPIALPAQTAAYINPALDALRAVPGVDGEWLAVIAAANSATAVLQDGIDHATIDAIVTLSAGNAVLAADLTTPVLLIAATQDATGPASFYAERVAGELTGVSSLLVLPGTQNGLDLLAPHWNPVRAAVLAWFEAHLGAAAPR